MTDRQSALIEVFRDTLALCSEDAALRSAVEQCKRNTVFLSAKDSLPMPEQRDVPCEIAVTAHRTFEAARL